MKKNKSHQMEYFTLFSKDDIYLYQEGTHYRLYEKLGAHLIKFKEKEGVYFAIWAPNAQSVAVIGDFNQWQSNSHLLKQIHSGSGIWEGFISEIEKGMRYKFHIKSRHGSYQTLGYFAPTSRYGSPQDFMYFVEYLHQQGIGIILDWVPSHFPGDEYGLVYFDGTHLYEHADPQKGFHPDWHSYIFNYGRNEVKEFLISSALFWLEKYHIDGLRVDAVASMLYLDYSRKEDEWIPNQFGGRENLEAIDFIKKLNGAIYQNFPDVQTIAEESTAWPMVSRPLYLGGLGFGMKWNMGWMHDTLSYFSEDPLFRKYHHQQLTFSLLYAFNENFVSSLSHDEVTHGKKSLLEKMPGDDWKKFANLRLLFGYMFAHPGKKLLFMGGEFGQRKEWNHDTSLDWHLLDDPPHQGIFNWIKDLNYFYKNEKALFQFDFEAQGFEWINANDLEHSVLIFLRKGEKKDDQVLVICNFV